MSAQENFSSNKAKQFFVRHGEKVVFGVCVLFVGIFLMLGRGVTGLEEGKTPTALKERAAAASLHMASDRWAEVKDARTPDFKLPEKVKEGRVAIDPNAYYSRLIPPAPEPQALREDPELLAPSKPNVSAIIAALPSPPRTDLRESPLDILPYAEVKKEAQPVARGRSREPAGDSLYGGGEGSGAASYGSGESTDPSMGAGSQTKEYRQTYPSVIKRLKGYRVPAGIPESQTMVIGTATLPIMDQWLEYKRKLEDAMGFDGMRDRPIYMWYEVQRQDVTEQSPEEAVWKVATASWTYEAWYRQRYGAGPPDVVDLAYYEGKTTPRLHDYALTSPIPLVLMRDIEQLVLHPLTPKRTLLTETDDETEDESVTDPEIADPGSGPPMGPPLISGTAATGASGTSSSGASMYSSGSGSGGDSYMGGEGEGGGESGMMTDFDPETGPAAPLKLLRFFDLNAVNGRDYRYRVRVALVDPNNPLAVDANAMSGTGESSGTSSYSSGASSYSSGASSYSSGASSSGTGTAGETPGEVSLRWLSEEVRDRIEKIREDDLKDPRNNKRRRVEWRYTEWSEPSDVVSVPTRVEKMLAGGVTPSDQTRISDDVSFAKDEPTGNLVVSQWIPYYAVEVPAEKKVSLGTLLNFEKDADVLHPIKLLIKRIEKHTFKTDAIVLDMRGGEPLPGSGKDNPIAAPGEFLVFDADGQLRTQSELEDMEEYRLKMLIPDDEEIEPQTDSMYGGEEESGGDDDFYGTSPGRPTTRRSSR